MAKSNQIKVKQQKTSLPTLLTTVLPEVRSFDDVANSALPALMHCDFRDEYLAYLLVEFCDFTGAEISTRSQSLLMNDIIDKYGLNKPEYFHLFFRHLREKGDWYGKVTAGKILAELKEFDMNKDDHFMHRATSKIERPEQREADGVESRLLSLSDAVHDIKGRLSDGRDT